jgi:hypothetical protein
MRLVIAAVAMLLSSTVYGDVLGLRFGMTGDAVRAAKLCKVPAANAAKASLTCKAVQFAGTKMDAELWLPRTGLARVGFKARIGMKRGDAEARADAILDRLVADYGPVEMTGVGELTSAAALFDGADWQFTRMKGKLKTASMFTAKHLPDDTMQLIGKVIRDREGYAIELAFVPRAVELPRQ